MGKLMEEFIDTYAKYRVWFNIGFADMSLPIAIISCAGSLAAVLLLKGISAPFILIGIGVVVVILLCIWWGKFCEKHNIPKRINSRVNQMQNKEVMEIHDDVKKIMKKLGVE